MKIRLNLRSCSTIFAYKSCKKKKKIVDCIIKTKILDGLSSKASYQGKYEKIFTLNSCVNL